MSVETGGTEGDPLAGEFLLASYEKKSWQLVLEAPDQVVSYLLNRKRLELYNLEKNFDVEIRVEVNPNLGLEEHKLYSRTAETS